MSHIIAGEPGDTNPANTLAGCQRLDARAASEAEATHWQRLGVASAASSIARLDVPAAEVEAATHLTRLLAHPPLGHVEEPQPREWYEAVFDDIATTYRLRQNAGGQS